MYTKTIYFTLRTMKNQHSRRLILLGLFMMIALQSLFAQAPAFPGAEGHGRYVTGGRGGEVIHVTNLNDSGTGSFRAAVQGNRKKMIVFDVGGVIALASELTIGQNTTILGQTAPYPGITIRYYTVKPSSNNIIRFIRFRRGQERDVNDGADAIWNAHQTSIIIDHCSMSWSIDELASFYDNNNFTMQWCMLGEALTNAGHDKGAHGYGGIWGGKLASFHHNYVGSVDNRAPRFNGSRYQWDGYRNNIQFNSYHWNNTVTAENVDFRNCVLYNWGDGNGCYGGPGGGQINIINNYYKAGPATRNTQRVTEVSVGNSGNSTQGDMIGMTSRYYIQGNYVAAAGKNAANYDWKGVTFDNGVQQIDAQPYTLDGANYYEGVAHKTLNGKSYVPIKLTTPAPIGDITTHSAQQAYENVLDYAGASLFRDNVDVRYAHETRTGTTTYEGSKTHRPGIIDIVKDVDGYTENNFPKGQRSQAYDSDFDGLPDAWEKANGLNPNDASDASKYSLDSKGYYTNLEVFANSLVEPLVKKQQQQAETAVNEYYPECKNAAGLDYYSGKTVELVSPITPENPTAGIEKPLYSTKFTDWEDAKASSTAVTKEAQTLYSHESLQFSLTETEVCSTNKNKAKFPQWQGGYLMASKTSAAQVTTSVLKNITKVHFKHGATGSKRGWKLEAKGTGDADWVTLSNSVADPTSGADVDVEVNKTNCRLRFTNLTSNQNAYLFELSIYGKVDQSSKPLLSSFKANGKTFSAETCCKEQADGTLKATIELPKSQEMISKDNPLTDLIAENGTIEDVKYTATSEGTCATIKVVLAGKSTDYVIYFVRKADLTLTYYNTDGTVIGTQKVEKDTPITAFAFNASKVIVGEGKVFRGWFAATSGPHNRKFVTSDNITSNRNLYAVATEKEVKSATKRYTFELTDSCFYDQDHEAFNSKGPARFHDPQHGWLFGKSDDVELLVGGNAYLLLKGCTYSSGNIIIKDSKGRQLASLPAKANTDGAIISYEYKGNPDVLHLCFDQNAYLHEVIIANMQADPIVQNEAGYYVVKPGDATHLLNTLLIANVKSGDQLTKIFIPNGVYDLGETVLTPINGNNISLIGASAEHTIIRNHPHESNEGIATTATLLITGDNTYLQDLTLENALDYYKCGAAGRAVTLQDKGNHTICKRVNLRSFQDTYYSNGLGQYYFEDGNIHGTVDYLCGSGDVFFHKVNFVNELRSLNNGGMDVIAAPYPTENNRFGYVMKDCKITNLNPGGYSLGRSWGGKSKLAWIETTMSEPPVEDGKSVKRFTVGGMNVAAYQFKEYGSKDKEGNLLTPTTNIVTFTHATGNYTYNTTMREDSVSLFSLDNVFPNWRPAELAAQATSPNVKLNGNILSWTDNSSVQPGQCYAVFKNDELITITQAHQITLNNVVSNAIYSVRSANAKGGFSEPSATSSVAGIHKLQASDKAIIRTKYFRPDGTACQQDTKGLVLTMQTFSDGTTKTMKRIVK